MRAYSYPMALALCFGFASAALAECPLGQPMSRVIAVKKGSIPMRDLWDMGADDFGFTGGKVILRVSESMIAQLDAAGVAYDDVCPDIDQVYREYRQSLAASAHERVHTGDAPNSSTVERVESFTDYHDLASVDAAMRRMADEHPDIVALVEIGKSLEGRTIRGLRISDNAAQIDTGEPAMLTMGCHHAREWISVEVPLYFADYLVTNYRTDSAVTRLVNYTEQWIVPVVNPDGFAYTRIGFPNSFEHRWWRKNRRNNGDGTFGVDINRNYLIGFGDDAGSSGMTFSETYRGTAPFSEPETQVIRDLMSGVTFKRTFATALSYHNYSQLVMYPNGYSLQPVENINDYRTLAEEMTRLINASHTDPFDDYIHGPSAETLYVASGTFEDWAHHTMGATAFIIELRPAGFPFFELPPAEITPTCRENLPAYLYLAERTLIPDHKAKDSDQDGYLDDDDLCPATPRGSVDSLGCASTQQDIDNDGITNLSDACRGTPAGQQVGINGCRLPALFSIRVRSNVPDVPVELVPSDIDGLSSGKASTAALTREYASATTVALTAPATFDGNRFVQFVVDGSPQPAGQVSLRLEESTNATIEAVYTYPIRAEIVGHRRLPDQGDDNEEFSSNYTVNVVYSDGSVFPAEEGVHWTLAESSAAAITSTGRLLPFDVAQNPGKRSTTIEANTQVGTYELTAEPVTVEIFDAETRRPNCLEITIDGPGRVESLSEVVFDAMVLADGDVAARSRPSEIRWTIVDELSIAELTPPTSTSASDGATLTSEWVAEDRTVVLRAAYRNDDRTACVAERIITIAAGNPADEPIGRTSPTGTITCGAAGMIGWLSIGFALALVGLVRARASGARR